MKSYQADNLLSVTNESIVIRYRKYMDALHEVADRQLSHPQVQDLIVNKRNHFDLLMVEAIYPTQMALSWWFQIPFIGMISLDAPSRIHAAVGNPVHPVLYPDYDLPFDKNLTFWERLISTIFQCFMMWYTEYRLHPREEATIRKHFGNNTPSINEIQKNMSMLFINVNPIFHNIRPMVPATVQIGGGLHLNDPKPLPEDIQEFLDSSHNGFIYFSLGTNVKSAALQNDTKETLIETLSELPFNVLWKFEDKNIITKSNVKVTPWVPQTAVLAQRNIKLFITQCGLQSMEEAIMYNVPMIGLPFYGDQGNNAKVLERKGLGITLDPKHLKNDELIAAIQTVTSDPMYKQNLKETAQLYKDEAMSGLEKAVWWTEYVIRHKGAKHLKSPAVDVPLYQYLLLDVIGFTVGVILFAGYLIKFSFTLLFGLLKFIYTSIFTTKSKTKKD
ncbi:hypothetical protein Zmor_006820 [Zophobas morio]|uniref:UDP-glucuronosyltransferase n=2 Tax=Zophobas morio TaxID=2755281 RepID=A0AA38IY92_9CUCU|nr:hypothetical protein Zmor_006820 [Zophobas morio]